MIRLALLSLVVLAAFPLGAAPSAHARGAFELGLQDDPVFVAHPQGVRGPVRHRLPRTRAYDAARKLRATALRINIVWAWTVPNAYGRRTPSKITYDWSAYDAAVDAALAAGLKPQLTLTGPAPAWATRDKRAGSMAPNPKRYRHFAAAAAAHFAGRVTRWSIWNEPNWYSLLQPAKRAPYIYRELFRVAEDAIREADPAAEVLIGEFAPMGRRARSMSPLRFLRAMTCRDRKMRRVRRCVPLVADGVAHHPYTLRHPPAYPGPSKDDVTTGSLGRLARMLSKLRRVGALWTPFGGTPPIYLTEYGFHANSKTIPPRTAARYLRQGLELAWRTPQVRQMILYEIAGAPPGPKPVWDTALLNYRGSPRPMFRTAVGWARGRLRP